METKYSYRHVKVAIGERDILKPDAVGKTVEELVPSDFQDWFVWFIWNRSRGATLIDRDGSDVAERESALFLHKAHQYLFSGEAKHPNSPIVKTFKT